MLIDILGAFILFLMIIFLLIGLIGFTSWIIPEILDNLSRWKSSWEYFRGNDDK